MYYIKRQYFNRLIEFNPPLSQDFNVSDKWDDYVKSYWISLTDAQVEFAKAHPEATAKQIYDMNIPEPSLEVVKERKIAELVAYDKSDNVNIFYINGKDEWVDYMKRGGLYNRLDAEEQMGLVVTTLWFNEVGYTLPITEARRMLQEVELYACKCFDRTEQHKRAIHALTSVAEVEAYDFTTGYPEILHFDFNFNN